MPERMVRAEVTHNGNAWIVNTYSGPYSNAWGVGIDFPTEEAANTVAAVIVAAAAVKPKPTLPTMPPVGAIVRARYTLNCGGHGPWPEGWTGEIMSIDDHAVDVQAHRYLPGLREWDNCRVINSDYAIAAYEDEYDRAPINDDQTMSGVLAFALLQEFEVIG